MLGDVVYVKLDDVIALFDKALEQQEKYLDKYGDRLDNLKAGTPDPHGRDLAYLKKMYYKHDMQFDAIDRLKFKVKAELDK